MAKKICEGVEKGSVKADIFEKSSYWYAILFFPPLHCSFNRGADLIATATKKERSEQRFAERFGKTGQQQVTCFFLLIYIIKRPEESQSGENYPP